MNALAAPVTAFMPGMADLLDALRPRYRLLMLSNIDAESFEEIRRDHPALDGFDALLTSGATGLAKPDRAAFENACKVAGAAPERCYFIDDAARHVEAARQLGIRGHVFSGSPALLTDLRSIGVAGLEGLA